MSRTQGYTWEEVMLNIDVKNEAERERKQQQDILDEKAAEETAMSAWSLGLSLIGAALFGPSGYVAGKNIGKWGVDAYYDWETMEVDPGKFYASEAKEFKETRDKAAKDQTEGQIFDAVTDLAMMYVQAGGLKEGFDPSIGGGDWTTFGTGEDAWTVFGRKGTETSFGTPYEVGGGVTWDGRPIAPGTELTPVFPATEATSGLFSGDLKSIGAKLKDVYAADQSINTMSDLGRLAMSYRESEEEKAVS